MRQIREVLRLKYEKGLGQRDIARGCGLGRTTVREYLERAKEAGLTWPLPADLDNATLEARLFPPGSIVTGNKSRPLPDWKQIHQELKRKGVTLELLWREYKNVHPDGFLRSRFFALYRAWAQTLDVSMRLDHKAGEKLMVDYAGQTMPVVDRLTGEIREAQIFVAVSCASNYTYAEATWTQGLPDWIASHQRAFRFFGGVHELIIPDNLKSGVTHPCRYEPQPNATYLELANHYGTAIFPARIRKPRDKAKVEKGVQDVERQILAALRHRQFFSLTDLNEAIAILLAGFNAKPFQKIPGCRKSLFEEMEKPLLKPLPGVPYDFAQWKQARVHIDYHIEIDRHYYSVPYQLVGQSIWVRTTSSVVECFHQHKRIASHFRSFVKGKHTTCKDHMPKNHKNYGDWSPERLLRWAHTLGDSVEKCVEQILASQVHPQQGYRSCLGLIQLSKQFGAVRLNAACARALASNAVSRRSIQSILKTGLDQRPFEVKVVSLPLPLHDNVRGSAYYQF
jgi:transposase